MCREQVTETPPWLPVLSELAMPFYLTHQQLLVPLAAAASWVPYLSQFYRDNNRDLSHNSGTFPIVLLLATLATAAVSWIIVKSGPVRYFFGLPTKKQSKLPGTTLRGFLPLLVMAVLFLVAALLANFL